MSVLHQPVSRRRFLQQSTVTAGGLGVGLAFPHLCSQAAAVGEGVREGVRIGCIAVGNQGKPLMLQNYKNVVAVCDVDKTRLEAAQKEIQQRASRSCAAYTDYRKLLENKEVDAVIIATPDHWHALQTVHACQAGKHVYVEKPLSLVVVEGRVMVNAARRYQRAVQTGSMQRSMAEFHKACEYVRAGRLGQIRTVKVGIPGVNFNAEPVADSEPPPELDYEMWLGPAPWRPYNKNHVHYNFRFFWDYSGGQMTNWGAHHLDIGQWGLGMDESGPVEIDGRAEYDPAKRYEVPTLSEVTYRYASGVTMILEQKPEVRIGTTFIGEKGSIYVNRGKLESDPAELLEKPIGDGEPRLELSKNHLDNWYACMKSGRRPICDVEVGHRSATVCHLGNISLRLGRRIRWDPKQEAILGDAEASQRLTYAYRPPWKFPEV